MLKQTFINLVSEYTDSQYVINDLWFDIEKRYSSRKRHYHTLAHLENVLLELLPLRSQIENWNVLLFSLYYHDIIYSSLKANNEFKSAEHAENQLSQLSISKSEIELCKQHILATKLHEFSDHNDTNYFTDADLSILGKNWNSYRLFFLNVRKEYAFFPTYLYNKGRRKALNHFLEMEQIYKTDFFYKKYEIQAKENLQKEINLLS